MKKKFNAVRLKYSKILNITNLTHCVVNFFNLPKATVLFISVLCVYVCV